MGVTDIFKRPKSMDELEDIEERKELELSIAQKNMLIKKLRAEGQEIDHFKEQGKISWSSVISWLKKKGVI